MWDAVGGSQQTLTAVSPSMWSVTGSEPSGHCPDYVCTYPEDSENYSLPVGSLNTVIQRFALSKVPVCRPGDSWEVASDDWLNALPGSPGAIEVMVFEDVCHTSPAGSPTGQTITVRGQKFALWVRGGTGPTYTLVSERNITSGAVHMAITLNYLKGLGYVSDADRLVQLNMGEEITSTSGTPETWSFSAYSNHVRLR
jgi:hypothetical protein